MHDNNGRAHCSITIRNKLTRGICKMLQQYTLSGWLWLHSHLLVWLRCLSVRLRGCLHRRVHGRGGIVGSWGVLVPRRKGGVVAQVPTRCSGLGRTSCGRKGNRDEFSLYQRSNPLSSSDYWKKWCPLYVFDCCEQSPWQYQTQQCISPSLHMFQLPCSVAQCPKPLLKDATI